MSVSVCNKVFKVCACVALTLRCDRASWQRVALYVPGPRLAVFSSNRQTSRDKILGPPSFLLSRLLRPGAAEATCMRPSCARALLPYGSTDSHCHTGPVPPRHYYFSWHSAAVCKPAADSPRCALARLVVISVEPKEKHLHDGVTYF